MSSRCALLLAAGDGKRMKSKYPKVLGEVLFRPMISWVADACARAGIDQLCAVVGDGAEQLAAALPPGCAAAHQAERLGTGHAVLCARAFLEARRGWDVLILCGDAPFITPEIIDRAYAEHTSGQNQVTVITARVGNPAGYGRILRQGEVLLGIVEERDASPEERKIDEINSGAYWFSVGALLGALDKIGRGNAQGEYYLTDAVAAVHRAGGRARACLCADETAVLGANDRKGLQRLNQIARRRVLDGLLEAGVDIPCEDGVLIDSRATVGRDTVILPGTIIKGCSRVGEGCVLGPNALLDNAQIGDGSVVDNTHVLDSVLEQDVHIGPYCRVRPGSRLCKGVRIGNFVEVKNAVLGEGTKSAHLTYIGDADIGAGVNFGCGTVVVNYDGYRKHRTVVGDNAFIGCNTNLVAPVEVGRGAYTAAGSTITRDVPGDALAIARAPQVNKENRVPLLKEKYGKKQK